MAAQRKTSNLAYFAQRPSRAVPVALYDDDQKLKSSIPATHPAIVRTNLGDDNVYLEVGLTHVELLALRSVPVRVRHAKNHPCDSCSDWLNWLCFRTAQTRARVEIECNDGKTFLIADDTKFVGPDPCMGADTAIRWVGRLALLFNGARPLGREMWVLATTVDASLVSLYSRLLEIFLAAMEHQLPYVHTSAIEHAGTLAAPPAKETGWRATAAAEWDGQRLAEREAHVSRRAKELEAEAKLATQKSGEERDRKLEAEIAERRRQRLKALEEKSARQPPVANAEPVATPLLEALPLPRTPDDEVKEPVLVAADPNHPLYD